MTIAFHEPHVRIARAKQEYGTIEPTPCSSQGQAEVSSGADLADLLSHQMLSCAAKVQTIAYLLSEVVVSSDPIPSPVLSTLRSVERQLRYLGYHALHSGATTYSTARLSFKPVDMIVLINDVVKSYQVQAPARQRVTIYDKTELRRVWGDAGQLDLVLDNLISNAFKYSAPQSPIIITAKIHQAPTDKDKGQMLVSITNFGSFIPPDEQEKLFVKFYRGSEDQQEKGYGLGLPLARWLVEMHGGQLEVESSIADGTTFWFTIPLATT